MTPGVVANVREVISSSLRSWIIESLEHFGVDSLVFLHVIQSILEQDVRSLRGEDAADDLWRGRLTSNVGSKRGGGGRDPKRQMNKDDLRRCVLLENMRACFKEDEFGAAEEFVDELLHRWTEEAQMNVAANGGVKNSSQDLREEMDDEENKETKDPVREYNEAFPALGTSPRTSPANPDHALSESIGRQNRNCGELLKELFYLNASSRNPRNVCPTESLRSSTEVRAKCCREVAKSMARDFVNSRVAANTQQNDSVRLLRSNELLEQRTNVLPDLSRRFFSDELRAADVCLSTDRVVGSELAPGGDPCARSSMPSLQTDCVQELQRHLVQMSNNNCPAQRDGSKYFPPLPPGVLSRTVEKILSQSLQCVPCCHVPPYGAGSNASASSCGCVRCSGGVLDFPIYTENEFGMLIRLGEDCSHVAGEWTNEMGYGVERVSDASHVGVGVGKDIRVSSDNPLLGSIETIAEEMDDLCVSGNLLGSVFSGQHSLEVERGEETRHHPHRTSASELKVAHQFVPTSMHQTDRRQWQHGDGNESMNSSQRQFITGKTQTSGTLPIATSHGQTVSAVGSATAAFQLKPLDANDFHASQRSCQTIASEVGLDLTDASSLIGTTRPTHPSITTTSSNSAAEQLSSSATPLCRHGYDGKRSASSSAASCQIVLRLLADVIERDLMNHIAASLIPLFPDLSAPHDLYLPDAEMLAHIAVQNCIVEPNCADALDTDAAFCGGMCENDYALYLHLAVREENLHVDHVLNFHDFCVWRRCLLQQVVSDKNVSCICDMCHRALKLLADSRYAFVDADAARPSLETSDRRRPVAESERESLLVAKSERKELQCERHGPDKRDDFASHFSSSQPPAVVTNVCVQHSSDDAGCTRDFTGKFEDVIMTNTRPLPGKDGSHGTCRSSVGEGDVLPQKLNDYAGVFNRSSLREIWPDGDADRKSDERWCGLKQEEDEGHFEEENNNNLESSFGCFSWPLSQGVALGNSVDIWLSSGTPLPSATSCRKVMSTAKSCDKTVLPDIASDKNISTASKYNSAGHVYDSAANVCDKVASADAICNKSANMCNMPVLPTVFCDQSALVTNSFGESLPTAASCSNWFCTDIVAETVSAPSSSISLNVVSPSESKLESLSPSIRTLERLLSSDDESSSSVQSFRSALHEDFYSLWLNTSPTHGHESGPLCAVDTSSDCGSQSLGSDDDDDDALRDDAGVHYEADISSSESSVDEGSCLRDKAMPSEADALFGLSFSIHSQPSSSSFGLVGIDDIISANHSKFPSSQSSFDSSETTDDDDRSDVSKPYSADCNSCSGEHVATGTEECKGLLSDWILKQPHVESYEGQAAECYETDSEDLEEPTLYRTWEECSSENFGRVIIPTVDVNLPDTESLTGLTFSFDQQEAVDLEKFEKLKSIWDESQLDSSKDLTAGCKPRESGSVGFNEGSFSGTFSQLKDVKGQLPGSDLECPASDDYKKLRILWDVDQTTVGGYGGGTATVWENSNLESLRGPVPIWNEHKPQFERVSDTTPDWNGNERAQENSNVLEVGWNEREAQTDGGARSGVMNWNVLHHQSNADSCAELTDECDDDVGKAENFEEIKSIWVGKKSVKYLKGGEKREVNANIEGERSVAYVMDGDRQVADSENLTNLSHLKSIWEEKEEKKEEVPHVVSSNVLNVAWDLSHVGTDSADGSTSSCARQTGELGSCKDLRELKSIWDEKEPCLASSKGVEQNWELNEMGGKLRNAKEVQQVWAGNQIEEGNFVETAANCFQQEPDSSNIQNILELRFIWEDESPQKSDNFKGVVVSSGNAKSISIQKSTSSSDHNQLNAENLLEPDVAGNDHQAASSEYSEDVGFTWDVDDVDEVDDEVDEVDGMASSTWDQQEPGTDDIIIVGPDTSSLHMTSDLDNCMLLTSIWERRPNDSGKTSGWEVVESRLEGKAMDMNLSNSNSNHKVIADGGNNDAEDYFQNRAQTLRNEKQKSLESLMGAIWEMNVNDVNDGEGGVEEEEGEVAYKCRPQGSDSETYQDLAQLKSLWGDGESDIENLRGAKLNWDLKSSEKKKLMKLASDEDHEDVGADSFQNLKSIWDEKLPDSENDDVKGLMLDWDVNKREEEYLTMRLSSSDGDDVDDDIDDQQEAEEENFQNLAQLKSIWEEKKRDLEDSNGTNLNWDMKNRMETAQPSHPNQEESDPGNFLNLSEVKSIWKGKQSSSESLEKLASCWENPAAELENTEWERGLGGMDDSQKKTSGNLMMVVDSGIERQQDNECRNLQSVWEGQKQPGIGNFKGVPPPSSCWTQPAVESDVLSTATSNWNTTHLSSESFDNSLFDLNCRKLESENFDCVDIKQSNSEIFLDRKLPDENCFRRPTSDRDLRYQEFGGIGASSSSLNVDLWQSDSDELKQMISRWDKEQTQSRGIRGLFSHFDLQQQQRSNLAAEWQLAEAVDQLKASDNVSGSGLWRLTGRNDDVSGLPKQLVPSENSAFQDEIPRRFVYRYAFFDPRDVRPRCDLATGKGDARTETIRHIYEPSNSIVRQLEDLFDDGQRLQTEDASSLLLTNNLPNCLFRPIGEQNNSGRDSYQRSVAPSVGLGGDDAHHDLSLQIKSPTDVDPAEEDVLEPNSPYQLYLGVESQTFVPRFRVHKELEKSAQTGEATPPITQNNECVFGMNVILSTIALLE